MRHEKMSTTMRSKYLQILVIYLYVIINTCWVLLAMGVTLHIAEVFVAPYDIMVGSLNFSKNAPVAT